MGAIRIDINPHYRDGETCKPNSGSIDRSEMKPFTGWRPYNCSHCGKTIGVFFMKSGGGQITRFWAEGHERMPSSRNELSQIAETEFKKGDRVECADLIYDPIIWIPATVVSVWKIYGTWHATMITDDNHIRERHFHHIRPLVAKSSITG